MLSVIVGVIGVLAILAGAFLIFLPAAIALFGVFCLLFAYQWANTRVAEK